jgi:hypothetical protein
MVTNKYGKIIQKYCLITALTMVALFLTTTPILFVNGQTLPYKLFSTDSSAFDVSYGDWIAKWWQWNVDIPLEGHPRDSYSPEKCSLNQNGPVWFLPDILAGNEQRTCTIPTGTAVLIPITTGACWNDGNPQFMSNEEIKTCAMEGNDGTFATVIINGTKIEDDSLKRAQSPYFNLTISENSWTRYNQDTSGRIFECKICPIGTFNSMADGYFLFLEPLVSGEYNVKISHDTLSNPNPEYRHAAVVTYQLIVEPPL